MSYQTLAERLGRTARRLRDHEPHLEGVKLAAAAAKLDASLVKFDALLDALLRGFDPDAVELRDLLESDAARAALDAKHLKLLAKKATSKALSLKAADSPQDSRKRLLDLAVAQGKAADTTAAVRAFLDALAAPAPPPHDRAAVLQEVWRLGKLAGADLELAKGRVLANEPLLRAMAQHTYVKVTPRSKPASILSAVIKFARRVDENVS